MVGGILGLVYGSFSYTKDSHDVKLGPLEMTIKNKETVNVPQWVGGAAVVLGGLLFAFGGRRA